ncbi:hypothetical protein SCYAM73S_05000 [Streptomyces cyaneofuscatus]
MDFEALLTRSRYGPGEVRSYAAVSCSPRSQEPHENSRNSVAPSGTS